ncbi:hypothetical protein HDU97_002710 [Phlyctochytrium planicorne]|nr:hypothetical protein HDU97_002710 [Phlyctochytrium planicorne]
MTRTIVNTQGRILAVASIIGWLLLASVSIIHATPIIVNANPPANNSNINVVLKDHEFNPTTGVVSTSIWVKNIAYSKDLKVIYSSPSGDWPTGHGFNATYSSSVKNSVYEIWKSEGYWPTVGNRSQFFVRLTVDDYDSNGKYPAFKNYPINPLYWCFYGSVPSVDNVRLKSYAYEAITKSFWADIWVKNLAYEKAVSAVYSDTKWNFTHGGSISASYHSDAPGGYELWKLYGKLTNGGGWGSQFFLKYQVTDYDNNAKKNYIVYGAPVVTSTSTKVSTSTALPPSTSSIATTSAATSLSSSATATATSSASAATSTTASASSLPSSTSAVSTGTSTPATSTASPTTSDLPSTTTKALTTTAVATFTTFTTLATSTSSSAASTPTEVINIKVLPGSTYDGDSQVFAGEIKIKNLGFNKDISIYYSDPSGSFAKGYKISSGYEKAGDKNGEEIWNFSSKLVEAGFGTLYYAEYILHEYDSNGGSNYAVEAGSKTVQATVPTDTLKLKSVTSESTALYGEIWVKDLAFNKQVTLFYSSNTGDFSTGGGQISANYVKDAGNGYQIWGFDGVLAATAGAGSKFYLRYKVSDYDSNGGANYVLPYVAPTTPSTTSSPATATSTELPTSTAAPVTSSDSTALPTSTDSTPTTASPTATSTPSTSNVQVGQVFYDGDSQTFVGEIKVKNLGFNKIVTLFYSDVSGDFSKGYKLSSGYKNSIEGTNYENWGFGGKLTEAGFGTSYYAEFDVNYYDSGNDNYPIGATPVVVQAVVPTGADVKVKSYSLDNGTLTGEIWVKDVTFVKTVSLFYSSTLVDFSQGGRIDASFDRAAENGYQVWTFKADLVATAGVGSKFYIQYTAKDFDSNGGKNYVLPYVPPTVPTTTDAPVPTATSTGTPTPTVPIPNIKINTVSYEVNGIFSGEVQIKNIAYNKVVNLFYSLPDNDFSAGLYLPLNYGSSNADGTETWKFRGALVRPSNTTYYYAEYYVEDFEGNGGANYPISDATGKNSTPSATVPKGGNIAVKSYRFNASNSNLFEAEIWVKDATYQKTLTLFYSSATGSFDGAGAGALPGTFGSVGENGYQVWKVAGSLPAEAGVGSRFYLKVSYKDYDSNDGKNYLLPYIAPPPGPVPTSTATATTSVPTATPSPTTPVYGNPNPIPPPIQNPNGGGKDDDLIRLQSYRYEPKSNILNGYVWLKAPTPSPKDPFPRATFTMWCPDFGKFNGTFRAIRQRVRAYDPNAPPSTDVTDPLPPSKETLAAYPLPTDNTTSILLYPFTIRQCGGFDALFYASVSAKDDINTWAQTIGKDGKDDNGGYFYKIHRPTDSKVTGRPDFGWKGRTVYQVLIDRFAPPSRQDAKVCGDLRSYCGGTFTGLTRNLDYVKESGYDAIWISPVVQNDPEGYHGYFAQNLYQVNPKFGTADELKELIAQAHARDIYIMVDVVANHLGGHNITSYSQFPNYPFNETSSFHSFCNIDYNNQTSVEKCWLGSTLPDLDTENPKVVTALYDWIGWLTKEFAFDGLRIDTAKHIPKEFWPGFVKASGNLFSIGEALGNDAGFVGSYQPSLPSLLNYPAYFSLYRSVFADSSKSMWAIESQLANDRASYIDTSVLGTFLDNHDQPRFSDLNADPSMLKNALALAAFSDGIPVIYYGTEFGIRSPGSGPTDPRNRQPFWEFYTAATYGQDLQTSRILRGYSQSIFRARKNIIAGASGEAFVKGRHLALKSDKNFHAFQRGNVLVALTNAGSGSTLTYKVASPFGTRILRDVLKTWQTYAPGADGQITITLEKGEPKILIAE